MVKIRILIIEDEVKLAENLKDLLVEKGYSVDTVFDGEDGEIHAELMVYDLIVLDVLLPKINGIELTKRLRASKCNMPILMLTANNNLNDRINGLNVGADYCLEKPFDSGEFLACVNALLRRQGDEINELSFGNTTLDLGTGIMHNGDKEIRLSAREFEVMRYLLSSKEKNVSKETLLERVWGYDSDAVENYVEVYIAFLRKKLVAIDSDVKIDAIRRLGYHLEVGCRG